MSQRKGSPSNREGTWVKNGHLASDQGGTTGVDRLSVSFPVDWIDPEEGVWEDMSQTRVTPEYERTRLRAREGPFFVSVETLPPEAPYGAMGKVEWNPSRIVDPEGWGVVPPGEALLTVGAAKAAAETRVRPVWETEDWKVKRLDVTRDFEASDEPSSLIRALSTVHRKFARLNLLHADAKRNGAQTLMVGTRKQGLTRLYDKHAETNGAAPEGTVRWELEARSGWCQRYGDIQRLGDVNGESVEALGVERFEWSGMGSEVSSSVSRLVQLVTDCDELSDHDQTMFLGYLLQQASGFEPSLNRKTLGKYRRVQRALGIVACDLTSTVEVVRRLDWDSGREVLRVA